MPFNGSGGFTVVNTFVPGTTILSSAVNQNYSDMASSGLSNCLTKDGQQTWAANQKAGGFIITGLTAGSASGNSVEWSQWGASIVPVGTVVDFAGGSAPSLWYFCYGQTFSTTAQNLLFNVIGYNYGGSGGSYSLPDYRGYVTAGKDNMGGTAAGRIGTVTTDSGTITGTTLGSTGGSSTHVQTSGELATHTHTATDSGHTHTVSGGGGNTIVTYTTGSNAAPAAGANLQLAGSLVVASGTANVTNANAGSSNAMALLQPTIMTNKIIFAGQ